MLPPLPADLPLLKLAGVANFAKKAKKSIDKSGYMISPLGEKIDSSNVHVELIKQLAAINNDIKIDPAQINDIIVECKKNGDGSFSAICRAFRMAHIMPDEYIDLIELVGGD